MIDEQFRPWLIEINTNPCLEISCPLLGRIIPLMVEQSLRLTLDVIFPPPCNYSNTSKHLAPDMNLEYLRYELIFDSLAEGDQIRELYQNVKLSKLSSLCLLTQWMKSATSQTTNSTLTRARKSSLRILTLEPLFTQSMFFIILHPIG